MEANLRKALSPNELHYRSLMMWTPWETSKECPEFKCTPPFILEGDVTVCIYVRTLCTIASIFGVADWTSPLRLRPWSQVHLVISMLTPSRSQCSMLPVRYSLRSRLRLHPQGGSTPFVHEACKAVHQGGGVGCAVAQHIRCKCWWVSEDELTSLCLVHFVE